MTSNIGAELIQRHGAIGFARPSLKHPRETAAGAAATEKEHLAFGEIKEKLLGEVRKTFRPEFINRIDDIIVFNPLKKSDILKIVDLELTPLFDRLQQRGIGLSVSDKVKSYLTEQGFDLHFGARPLKRTIQRYIQDPLSRKILEGSLKDGDRLQVDLSAAKEIVFKTF